MAGDWGSLALGNGASAQGALSMAMGYGASASGGNDLAIGNNAISTHTGAFVWADCSLELGWNGYVNTEFYSINTNEFAVRATGGVRFVTAINDSGAPAAGVSLPPGGTSWGTICDRNAKKNFTPVNGGEILDKLAAVPVEKWNYKWEKDSDVPNIGPMAQAFKAAFYPGRDDKSITTLEFDGVELAAIQGLNQKVEEKETRIQEQAREIADMKARLEKLEQFINSKNGGGQ
jgi:hypothetical protein